MQLHSLKAWLQGRTDLRVLLPNGQAVAPHFHLTEVGETTKSFIDCGGKLHHDRMANLQLWSTDLDPDHRLRPEKLLRIIELAESKLGLGNLEVQVEYQGPNTLEIYRLEAEQEVLRLTGHATDCLARVDCGLTTVKADLEKLVAKASAACTPGSGCC